MIEPRPILHEFSMSGNCYKVRLTAAQLGIAIERREYDILQGATRTPGFLADVNPNGRIPVLQIGRRFLPESNAACVYLADGSALIPKGRFEKADMLRWMFWEQYSHEPNIATMRLWKGWIGFENLSPAQAGQIDGKMIAGNAALELMDKHLRSTDWFAADHFTLADISLYAYTHVAAQGGFNLQLYPAIGSWLERVAGQSKHIPLHSAPPFG